MLVFTLIELVKKHNATKDPKIRKLRSWLYHIEPKTKRVGIYEDPDYAYIVNKRDIYIVIKDKNGDYYDDNTLMHVLLHEAAHALNKNLGHGPKFYKIFYKLKTKANELGLYDPDKPLNRDYPIKKTK